MTDERKYINLLRKDLANQAQFIPENLYTENIISVIVIELKLLIIKKEKIKMNADIFKVILNMYPELLNAFEPQYVEKVITQELKEMIINGKVIAEISRKYDISKEYINTILNKIKLENIELYNEINEALEKNRKEKKANIIEDLNNLNHIISLLGPIENNKLTLEQKIKFTYLYGRYIHTSLEDIYHFEYKTISDIDVTKITNFFNNILKFSNIFKPNIVEEKMNINDMILNNSWYKPYDRDKFFGMKDGVPTIDNKYGKNAELLTLSQEQVIIETLKLEGIALNDVIVKSAFREFFKNNLFEYINLLKGYDQEFQDKLKEDSKKLTRAI